MSNATSPRRSARPTPDNRKAADASEDENGEMAIFTKTYDFLAWLTPATNHFPRAHRYGATHRLLAAGYAFLEHITEANNMRGSERLRLLTLANGELDKVRLYLRLVNRWRWLSEGQYAHCATMVAEMGRLLGGWQKRTRQDLDAARQARSVQ